MKTQTLFRIILVMTILTTLAACASNDNNNVSTISPRDNSEVTDSLIMTRRSIRKYTEKRINRDTLDIILKHGINAPNGQNRQAYEIRVVDNPDLLLAISSALVKDNPGIAERQGFKSIFAGAPCVIFLANDTTYDMSQVDCGLLGENIILSAWSMGIGTCCMAQPIRMMKQSAECAPFLEKLGFSEGYNLLYCIVMGYPEETPDAKPRKEDRIKFVN